MTHNEPGFGLYVHWPFCQKKCPYCDYNSHVRESVDHDQWAHALCSELSFFADNTDKKKPLTSIFFGGGTPSLMHPKTVEKVISEAESHFGFSPDIEITLEANPTSSEAQKFQGFYNAGVNRISIGVQALDDKDLKFLGREHNVKEALDVIELAEKIYPRFSFDLIYGRPNQTLKSWREELELALNFAVGHISLYQLTIEPGTQFDTRFKRGDFQLPTSELEAELYDLTGEVLENYGFSHYEISSFSKPGQESRHNMVYWDYQDYLGIGPGAHGRFVMCGERYASRTHAAPEIWLERVLSDKSGAKPFEKLSAEEIAQEMLMMALRVKKGVCLSRFKALTGFEISAYLGPQKLDQMIVEGYLDLSDTHLSATAQGRQTLNSVLAYILP